jgi:DNA-binding CsgD family transcriptional regulator
MKIKFLSFFKKKKKKARRKARIRHSPKNKNEFNKLKSDFNDLKAQFGIVNILLKKHDEEITENSILLKRHVSRIEKLEEIVAKQPTNPTIGAIDLANRPVSTTELVSTPKSRSQFQSQKLDISHFTPQEKRILSVFFQNQGMALSYADIAHYLGKSPNTIKNQVRQINMKADLFNYTVDNESRKRYKLKEGLKIEKYLNIKRPDGSPNRLN